MAGLVYYSSASGNTERFMHKLGLPAMRIPVDESAPMPEPDAPFVLISPTYADGEGHGAVARPGARGRSRPDDTRSRMTRGLPEQNRQGCTVSVNRLRTGWQDSGRHADHGYRPRSARACSTRWQAMM